MYTWEYKKRATTSNVESKRLICYKHAKTVNVIKESGMKARHITWVSKYYYSLYYRPRINGVGLAYHIPVNECIVRSVEKILRLIRFPVFSHVKTNNKTKKRGIAGKSCWFAHNSVALALDIITPRITYSEVDGKPSKHSWYVFLLPCNSFSSRTWLSKFRWHSSNKIFRLRDDFICTVLQKEFTCTTALTFNIF